MRDQTHESAVDVAEKKERQLPSGCQHFDRVFEIIWDWVAERDIVQQVSPRNTALPAAIYPSIESSASRARMKAASGASGNILRYCLYACAASLFLPMDS